MDNNNSSPKPRRKRARKPNGSFQGDNPSTPEHNEAWEAVELAEEVGEKTVKYSVEQKVTSTSEPTAGKYGKKGKIRPTFGNVTSTTY
jgi:hypothetical protein